MRKAWRKPSDGQTNGQGTVDMNYTEELARFVVGARIEHLPLEVIGATKRCFLDWIGAALGAAGEPSVNLLIELIRDIGGKRQASILGCGIRTNVLNAALANGMMSHVLDIDDAHSGIRAHPSAPLVPALLAVAEWRALPGRDLIAAFVAGYETTIRIGLALGKAYYDAGWHATSVLGRFGAAAGAGRLLGLTTEQLAVAFGLAATQAGGVRDVFGSMGKPFHPGKAAMDGVLAALLAMKGFTAPTDLLQGQGGFPRLFSAEYTPQHLTRGLGRDYHLLDSSFKPYAACLLVHPVIDGLVALRQQWPMAAESIEEIHVELAPLNISVTDNPEPKDGTEGKFSLQLAAALALLYGSGRSSLFTDDAISQPAVKDLMKKVRVVSKPSIQETEAHLTVKLKGGTHYTRRVVAPKGDPRNPLTFEDIAEKVSDLAAKTLPRRRISRIIEIVRSLERLDNSALLVRLCCKDRNCGRCSEVAPS